MLDQDLPKETWYLQRCLSNASAPQEEMVSTAWPVPLIQNNDRAPKDMMSTA